MNVCWTASTNTVLGEGDSWLTLLHRAARWNDDFLHHGIHYCRQCKFHDNQRRPLANFEQSSILSASGGTCICENPIDRTCATDPIYEACLLGQCRLSLTDCPR